MSGLSRSSSRLSSVTGLSKLSQTKKTTSRSISWMAFEQLDPALYPPPPSLQNKRPSIEMATGAAADAAHPATPGANMGATPPTARTREALTSGKMTPASSLGAGPTPLLQVQKRPFVAPETERAKNAKPSSNYDW